MEYANTNREVLFYSEENDKMEMVRFSSLMNIFTEWVSDEGFTVGPVHCWPADGTVAEKFSFEIFAGKKPSERVE
jgi:hypothetical protein